MRYECACGRVFHWESRPRKKPQLVIEDGQVVEALDLRDCPQCNSTRALRCIDVWPGLDLQSLNSEEFDAVGRAQALTQTVRICRNEFIEGKGSTVKQHCVASGKEGPAFPGCSLERQFADPVLFAEQEKTGGVRLWTDEEIAQLDAELDELFGHAPPLPDYIRYVPTDYAAPIGTGSK